MASQKAIRTKKDIPGWSARLEAKRAESDARAVLAEKSFSKLSDKEKDQLLGMIAVQLGLVKP